MPPDGLTYEEHREVLRNCVETVQAKQTDIERLLDTLADVIGQACDGPDGVLDSMALSAYADGLWVLADFGRVHITEARGRRVIATWPKE